MAGKYVKLVNPGYSTLWTRDLPYKVGTGEAADLNVFNPDSARPLVEGEFLELADASGKQRFSRGGNNAMAVSGTKDNEGTIPAFLHFMESGRTDTQYKKVAHCIMGPAHFEFRIKTLCISAGLSVGDKVSVWDYDGPSGAWGIVRRILAAHSAGFSIGRVSRLYGTNDIGVIYGMQ